MATGHARVSLRNTALPYENTATGRAASPESCLELPPTNPTPTRRQANAVLGKKKSRKRKFDQWLYFWFLCEGRQARNTGCWQSWDSIFFLSLSGLKAEKDPGEEGGWSSFLFSWGFFQEMEGKSGDVKPVEEEEVVQDKASSGEAKSESSSETDELLLGGAKNDAAKQGDAGSPDLSMVQPWTNGATCNRCCQVCSFFLFVVNFLERMKT